MSKIKILIVEGEAVPAKEIQNILKRQGYTVSGFVSSGEETIRKISEYCPDLVLMDVVLNGDMDGIEAARQIKDSLNVPVIFLTAHSDDTALQRAKITEPYGYISRPFEEKDMYAKIEMALYKHKMEDDLRNLNLSLERRVAERTKELKERESRLINIIANNNDGNIVIDKDGIVRFINPSVETILNRKKEDLIGSYFGFPLVKGEVSEIDIARGKEVIGSAEMRVSEIDWGDETAYLILLVDITERKQAENTIHKMAYYDMLTGMPNRTLLKDRLLMAISNAHRNKEIMAVMFLDLDEFKMINDTLGHSAGDMLLKRIAKRLQDCIRKNDTTCRMGGDEFIILLPVISQVNAAAKVAMKILEAIRKPMMISGRDIQVSSSIGIAIYPNDGQDPETLLKNADAAMYHAKAQGKNNYQLYTSTMHARVSKKLKFETGIRNALKNREFMLHYQPQIDVNTGQIDSFEALIRWQHPELGLVSPSEFIPFVESNGQIVPIGDWVLRTACMQNKVWHKAGHRHISVAINLSSRSFQQSDLEEKLGLTLKETGIAPSHLEIEITEGTTMQSIGTTVSKLERLSNLGIHISIDDFGTGYSSLSYLKKFRLRTVKIDQSFVQGVPDDPDNSAIITAIIAMVHSLKLKVVAEGVETVRQAEFLRSLKCDKMQGYLFSKPLPPEEATRLLEEGKGFDF